MVEERFSYNARQKRKNRDIQDILEMHLKNRSIDSCIEMEEKGRSELQTHVAGSNSTKEAQQGHGSQQQQDSKSLEGNLITYASLKNELDLYDEQYLSLKTFLTACNGTYRAELLQILFPIFSVFVTEQLDMEQLSSAQTFFQKYYSDHEEKYKRELEDLLQLMKVNEFDNIFKARLADFKSRKFSVTLSSKTFGYLMQHLRNNNHSLLLQTINKNLDIKTLDKSKLEGGTEWMSGEAMELGDAASEDGDVRLLNESIQRVDAASKTKPSITLYSFVNAYQGLSAVKFSPNGNVICAGFEDSSVRLWSLNMKKLGQTTSKAGTSKPAGNLSAEASSSNESIVLRGHRGPIYAVQFLPEGNAVLSASEDCSVRLWSVQSQTSMVEYRGHNYPVWDISSGCKGSYFVSASKDQTLRLWTTEYAFPLRIFAGHVNSVDCVQFHPNGNYVASGSSDKTCRLWDLQSAQFVRVFVGHEAPIYAATFSPDGNHLVSAGDDNRVLVWDLRNGKILKDLRGHTDTLYSVAFSKDSSMLVSGGLDNSIRVWNAEAILKLGTDDHSSNDTLSHLISAYSTKATSVLELHFSQGNLLLAAGLHETR